MVVLLAAPAGRVSAEKMYRPVRVAPIEVPPTDGGASPGFKSDVSRKNLLGLERPAPLAMPTARHGIPITSTTAVDTLNVLVLKIEFLAEVPDNPRTTGDGTFDMRSFDQFYSDENHYIDPAPHGNGYFNSHMEALRRYWYFVSDKKLDLSWDIYPQQETLAFQLPVSMSYYGPQGHWPGTDNIADRLGYFFIDAIHLADSLAPQIDFSSYQSIILFHAGSDQQNNIAFINDTPDDFFTGFLILSEPLFVDNGLATVQEGLIMPETATQDNRVTALNAVLAHEFGHQLGLIDLYNTSNFMTQVGDFALMDNNGLSVGVQFPDIRPTVGGTLPVYPSAWSRAYLGFDVPALISDSLNVPITAAALHHDDSEIVRVPVTDFEYFLIENRQVDADTLPYNYPFDNILIGDSISGVILGPGYAYFEGNDTILVSNSEYDRLLPGSGMLIWHVDEYVAYQGFRDPSGQFNNYQTNSLQWNSARRFLTLVEADGIIDFGGNYYRGYGSYRDFFRPGISTSMTPYTRPSSRSNLGADSHIFVTDISVSDTLMTCDIAVDWLLPGWPRMSHPVRRSHPLLIDLDDNDSLEVLAAGDSVLLAFRYNGGEFVPNSDSIGIRSFDGSVQVMPWAVAASIDAAITNGPVAADLNGDNIPEIALADSAGYLYLFESTDLDFDGRLDPVIGSPVFIPPNPQASGQAIVSLMAVDFDSSSDGSELLAVDNSGNIHIISSDGADNIIYTQAEINSAAAYTVDGKNVIDISYHGSGGASLFVTRLSADSGSLGVAIEFSTGIGSGASCSIVSTDINRDGGLPELIAIASNKITMLESNGSIAWTVNSDFQLGLPALGDINSDGYTELVVCAGSSVLAYNRQGLPLTDFPINLGLYDLADIITAPPVLADIDGDQKPDIIVGLPSGSVYAFNYRGDRIGGFPLPSSFGIENACAAGDLDNDGDIDLVTIEGSGIASAWDISSAFVALNAPWSMSGGGPSYNNYLSTFYEKPVIAADPQLPENSVYNYPNPASNSTTIRYYLNSSSDVSIDIYDFMGELVHSTNLRGLAHMDNEYVWNCSDIASGVYFCRVEADNGVEQEWRMIKIALVK